MLGAEETLRALEMDCAEECTIVSSLETDGTELTLGVMDTLGAAEALSALRSAPSTAPS